MDGIKLSGKLFLATLPVFILPTLILGPFAILGGVFAFSDLITLLASPSVPMSILGLVLAFFLTYSLLWGPSWVRALKRETNRTVAVRKKIHQAMGIFFLAILVEGTVAVVVVHFVNHLPLHQADLWVILYLLAFLLFVGAPLYLNFLRILENACSQEGVHPDVPAFSLLPRIVGVIIPFVSGALILIITVSETYRLREVVGPPPPLTLLQTNLIVGLFTLVLAFVLVRTLAKLIVQPLVRLKTLVDQGTGGDMTVRSQETAQDEIGFLSRRSTDFFESLDQGFGGLKREARSLEDSKKELNSVVERVRTALTAIGSEVEQTGGLVNNQSEYVNRTATAVEELARNIESLDSALKDQKQRIDRTSSSFADLEVKSQEILQAVENARQDSDTLKERNKKTVQILEMMSNNIQTIVQKSEGLMEANHLIASVASQTNLLAMNAAIEAAHAGDAGKGFSVVADEIRKLAETSSSQSNSITSALKGVQQSITEISRDNREILGAFDETNSAIQDIFSTVTNLKIFVDSFNQSSRLVQEAMTEMEQINDLVNQGSIEMRQGNGEILDSTERLRESSALVLNAVGTISLQTRQIQEAGDALLASNGRTDQVIQTVAKLVAPIKTSSK